MSREITYVANLSATVNGQTAYLNSLTAYANMSGTRFIRSSGALTTVLKLLDTGELTTIGVSCFQNTSATQTVEIYTSLTGAKVMSLLPGETWMLRLGTTTPAAKTLAGTATVSYLICES